MEIKTFIENFADQFEDASADQFAPETNFREFEGWSSLVALSVLAMIDEEYDVQLKGEEMKKTTTIQQLFDLVQSKLD